MLKNKKGQSTVEYLLVFTAIIAILIIFLNPTTGIFAQRLNRSVDSATNQMENVAARVSTAFPASP